MPGDPRQCREHAHACAEMARKAKNPGHRQMLENLAHTWLSLANEIERSDALVETYPPDGTNHVKA
jgi:hypothetical protein